LQQDAKDGGAVAGRDREDIERLLATPVVSDENYLEPQKQGPQKSTKQRRREERPVLFPELEESE